MGPWFEEERGLLNEYHELIFVKYLYICFT